MLKKLTIFRKKMIRYRERGEQQRKAFRQKMIAGHDLPDIHIHSLRHTTASSLINSPETAATVFAQLGHAATAEGLQALLRKPGMTQKLIFTFDHLNDIMKAPNLYCSNRVYAVSTLEICFEKGECSVEDLIKFEVIKLPKLYIIGKELRYSDEALNNGDNRLPSFWRKCYRENIFMPLESQPEHVFTGSHAGVFLDWDLGDGDFSYIVGMLMKDGATIPEGYCIRELAETDVALCWVKCRSLAETRTVPFDSAAKAIGKIGRTYTKMKWCADLYHPSRSTTPDENGEVILDCYIPLD